MWEIIFKIFCFALLGFIYFAAAFGCGILLVERKFFLSILSLLISLFSFSVLFSLIFGY